MNTKALYLIVGANGITGQSIIKHLETNNIPYIPYDDKNTISNHPIPWEKIKNVIKTPGVPFSHNIIQEAIRRNIQVISDFHLAYPFIKDNPIIAITGTNGKSTTTALTHHLISFMAPAVIGGNIGIPILSLLTNISSKTYIVLELSSFQLEYFPPLRLRVASILNLTPDHLDRYSTVKQYYSTKFNIFNSQTPEDIAVLNFDDLELNAIYSHHSNRYKHIPKYFSISNDNADLYINPNTLEVYLNGSLYAKISSEKLPLIGIHNIENIAASLLILHSIGLLNKTSLEALYSFKPLPHRMELVINLNGIKAINDSKATTPHSLLKALQSFTNESLILLAGGLDKNLDFSIIPEKLLTRVKLLIAFGKASDKVYDSLKVNNKVKVKSLKEAIKLAVDIAEPRDTILLSPGCASFDEFKNYEERGDYFKEEVVRQLKSKITHSQH